MMGGLLLRMAVRGLARQPRRSLLTAGAIGFGLACLVIFVALKTGLHREMVASTVRLDLGSLQVHAAGYQPNSMALKPLPDAAGLQKRLAAEGLVVAPRLKVPALAIGPAGSASVVLSGVDPERERRLTIVARRLVRGDYLAGPESLLIGEQLAASLGVKLGDEVNLMVRTLFGRPAARRFVVDGVFRTDLASFNRGQLFIPLPSAQKLVGGNGLVSELAVLTPEGEEGLWVDRLAARLDAARYRVDGWRDLAVDVAQLIELNDGTMNLLMLIIFFIVALGIANTMTMSVYERYREFGIIAALGLRPGGIVRLVLGETLLLGLFGGLLGSLAGALACLYLGRYGIDLTALTSANRYFATSHVLHAVLRGEDVLLANLVTLTTAFLAGLLPAWRASKLEPVEALRHI
ncbi:ABC-type lipoprotein release transport system permease subunit [Geothermobacter ehrlichii]|uniref:ABC-type lipoprotein release transport system permease subunit n=1 Tax=Geothermobacter ehrlichii TaxID=213224 RepID=A0A5D3WLQ0_9BACT|nr:FtsX-like permease family protein [Geothermobacter ehrlichii]TYO98937.1 ABC-type lipoprotein release transport system permease subunit [Geothermobacter ehrlichii]